MILQINQTIISSGFLQYGIVGLIALLLGYFAWQSYNRLVKKNDALERKVDALQLEVTTLLMDERDRMSRIIEDNTRAIGDLRSIILNTLIRLNETKD